MTPACPCGRHRRECVLVSILILFLLIGTYTTPEFVSSKILDVRRWPLYKITRITNPPSENNILHQSNGMTTTTTTTTIVRPHINIHRYNVILQNNHSTRSAAFGAAMDWLNNRQNPAICDTTQVTIVQVGRGGGFGSMFQRAATLVAEVIGNGQIAVLQGHYKGYTRNRECGELSLKRNSKGDGGLCFFKPISTCVDGKGSIQNFRLKKTSFTTILNNSIPEKFQWLGRGFWWGVLQGYMFRLNTRMVTKVQQVKGTLWASGSTELLKYIKPDIVAHIRLGDKQVDIQSLQSKVQQNRIIEDYITQVEYFLNRIQKEQRCNVAVCRKRVVVYVATDSSAAVTAMRSWASAKDPAQRIHLAIRDTLTQNISGEKNEIAKLLQLEASFGYKAGEEVIIDLALMMEARFFVGLCMSQLARIAVSIGYAMGRLEDAVAIDSKNIPRRDNMKLGIDLPWRAPDVETVASRPSLEDA